MLDDTITAVLATDHNYARGTAACIRSVANALPEPTRLSVVILDTGLNSRDRSKLVQSSSGIGKLEFKPVTPQSLQRFNTSGADSHITNTTWARVFIPEFLPSLSRAIWLDSDLIVLSNGNIADLWETDLNGHLLGAVPSPGVPTVSAIRGISNWQELGIDPTHQYFNAGVLLMDLDAMRATDFAHEVAALAEMYPETPMADQGILNLATVETQNRRRRWLALDRSWNEIDISKADRREPLFGRAAVENIARSRNILRPAIDIAQQAKILHITGKLKPWHQAYNGPYVRELYNQLENGQPGTAWRGQELEFLDLPNVEMPPLAIA